MLLLGELTARMTRMGWEHQVVPKCISRRLPAPCDRRRLSQLCKICVRQGCNIEKRSRAIESASLLCFWPELSAHQCCVGRCKGSCTHVWGDVNAAGDRRCDSPSRACPQLRVSCCLPYDVKSIPPTVQKDTYAQALFNTDFFRGVWGTSATLAKQSARVCVGCV